MIKNILLFILLLSPLAHSQESLEKSPTIEIGQEEFEVLEEVPLEEATDLEANIVPEETVKEEVEEDYLKPFEQAEKEYPAISREPVQKESQALFNRSSFKTPEVQFMMGKRLLFRDKLTIGYETTIWDYEEFKDGGTFMKDSGQLHGVRGSYEKLLSNDSTFWNLSVRYLTGKTLYEGGDQDGNNFNLNSTNSITEFGTGLGHTFSFTESFFFKPSLGLSYRILSNPKNNYPGSYSREAQYFTIPINLEFATMLTDHFHMSLGVNYHYLLDAQTKSKLSETPFDYADINNQQNVGKGYGAYLKLSWLRDGHSFHLRPYYRVWEFGDSEPVFQSIEKDLNIITYSFKEPENRTKEIGLNLSIGF
jgi:hypothetical protein